MADLPPATVWDDSEWQRAANACEKQLTPEQIASKSVWRDKRLAALVAHKRAHKTHSSD
jgi:L-gulonate 3-dehydrogenase